MILTHVWVGVTGAQSQWSAIYTPILYYVCLYVQLVLNQIYHIL